MPPIWQQVGGFLLQRSNRLQFIPTAEGRILPPALADNGGAWAYEYSYKDHLGNLRLSFRPGRSYSYKATMESSEPAKSNEQWMFSNLTDAIRVTNGCVGGGIKLTSTNPMGPMRVLKVRRGDVITAKVKGWYSAPAISNGGLQLWLQAVPDGNVPGQSEIRQNLPSLRVGLTLNLPDGDPLTSPSGGNNEYLIGLQNALSASANAGKISFTFNEFGCLNERVSLLSSTNLVPISFLCCLPV